MIGHFQDTEIELPDPQRYPHLYLVGQTGSGKSELLKAIVHSLLKEECAIALIDPDGKVVDQIAHWPEWNGSTRLCYFNPTLERGFTPCINPLEPVGVSHDDTSERGIRIKQVLAEQLLSAFQQLVEGDGGDVSRGMSTLLLPCLLTLFDRPGSTLRDLQRFMEPNQNADLIEHAKKLHHYPNVPSYFEMQTGFNNPHNKPTKSALFSRLQQVLNSSVFSDVTCGESTVDLSRMIDWRKVMLFNLADGVIGTRGSQALGRLIVALIQGIATRRAEFPEKKYIPVHLIIDECSDYISDSVRTVMLRARKYGLYLTLAQQNVGDRMSSEVWGAIKGNASVAISGQATRSHLSDAAKLLDVEPYEITRLNRGEFLMSVGNYPPRYLIGRDDLLGRRHSMTELGWRMLKVRQLRAYYRPKVSPAEAPEPEPAAKADHDGFDDSAARWE